MLNWLPLGVTYAFVYMGRYTVNVAQGPITTRFGLSRADYGDVMGIGLLVYGIATTLNGPLSDRLGGRKSMLIGAFGAALLNLCVGLVLLSGVERNLLAWLIGLHAVNMYFQSFCALALVKVNAPWFHVRERGIFQGVFGVLISSGYLIGFYGGGHIAAHHALQFVFLTPAVLITAMAVFDFFQLKNKPSDAGFPDFNTGDATAHDHDKDAPVTMGWILKRILTNRVILALGIAEFCTGYLRYGLLNWFVSFLREVHGFDTGSTTFKMTSLGITIGGIVGGFSIGFLSDRFFHSRRPPVAAIYYAIQVFMMFWLVKTGSSALAGALIGVNCIFVFGIHGLLSGTSSMDFGGTKGAATVTGLFNGVHYLGAYLAGRPLGWVLDNYHWDGWAWAVVPFSATGFALMLWTWHATPLVKKRVDDAPRAVALEGAAAGERG